MMRLSMKSNGAFSKVPLFILRLVVYSNSSLLAMTFLSLYGLIHGVARVPKKRVSGMKSLIHYGAEVFQHGLHPSTNASVEPAASFLQLKLPRLLFIKLLKIAFSMSNCTVYVKSGNAASDG